MNNKQTIIYILLYLALQHLQKPDNLNNNRFV